MSLPRPGGRPQGGETKSGGGGGGTGYGGGAKATAAAATAAPSAFAGYTPPSANPPNPYTSVTGANGAAGAGSGLSFGGGGGYGGGGGFGGGAFGGAGAPQGFGGGGATAGGALGGGGVDGRNQYGFSNSGGGGGLDTLGASMGAVAGAAMGMAAGGAQQKAGGARGGGQQQQQQQQQPLDWHQWTPDGMNAQMLNVGGNVASNFLKSNVAQYQPRVSGYWNTLKVYFTVDNRYVLKKLKVLLLSVLKKDWFRLPSEDEVKDDGRPKFERPVADVNAPDLYVPLMSFITFVLLTGYAKGSAAALSDGAGTFSPEV
ncbi:unnamed protein product, partial [Ectocarpus sp. 12 AP-2014]